MPCFAPLFGWAKRQHMPWQFDALQKAAATPSKYEQHYPGNYCIPSQHMEDIFPGIINVNFQGCTLSKLTSLMIYRQCTFMSCIAIVLKCSMVSEHNLDKQMNNVKDEKRTQFTLTFTQMRPSWILGKKELPTCRPCAWSGSFVLWKNYNNVHYSLHSNPISVSL